MKHIFLLLIDSYYKLFFIKNTIFTYPKDSDKKLLILFLFTLQVNSYSHSDEETNNPYKGVPPEIQAMRLEECINGAIDSKKHAKEYWEIANMITVAMIQGEDEDQSRDCRDQ